MEIVVKQKTVYGNQVFYPANAIAKAIAACAKQTTLTVQQLRTLKDAGATVTVETDAIAI